MEETTCNDTSASSICLFIPPQSTYVHTVKPVGYSFHRSRAQCDGPTRPMANRVCERAHVWVWAAARIIVSARYSMQICKLLGLISGFCSASTVGLKSPGKGGVWWDCSPAEPQTWLQRRREAKAASISIIDPQTAVSAALPPQKRGTHYGTSHHYSNSHEGGWRWCNTFSALHTLL